MKKSAQQNIIASSEQFCTTDVGSYVLQPPEGSAANI